MINIVIEKGFAAAKPHIESAHVDYPDWDLFSEGVLNWLGYHFLYWWGREAEAVEVMRLNAELHPSSANVYDSFGEALSVVGEVQKAIVKYKKSLELNPENENAKRQLASLSQLVETPQENDQ